MQPSVFLEFGDGKLKHGNGQIYSFTEIQPVWMRTFHKHCECKEHDGIINEVHVDFYVKLCENMNQNSAVNRARTCLELLGDDFP